MTLQMEEEKKVKKRRTNIWYKWGGKEIGGWTQFILVPSTWTYCGWRKVLIDWLLFYVPLKNISLTSRRHYGRWRAAYLGLCSALGAFEQGGIFIVPHLLWHGTSVFPVSSILTRILTGLEKSKLDT
jgi:hypothetical protein